VDLPDGTRAWVEMREGQTAWLEAWAFVDRLEGEGIEAPDWIEVAELLVASDRREVVARVEVEMPDGTSAWAEMRDGQTALVAAESFLRVMARNHGDLGHRREEVADLLDAEVFGDVADSTTRRVPLVFLHFSKTGGTSVVGAMESGGRMTWPFSSQAKPFDSQTGGFLPIWTYSADQWRAFWRRSWRHGVDLVELEWDFFADFREKSAAVPSDWVTVLRDPYARFVSSFWFFRRSFGNFDHSTQDGWEYMATTPGSHVPQQYRLPGIRTVLSSFPVSHNEPNYYVKVLNGLGTTWGAEVGPVHLEHAKAVLRSFTTVAILEDRASMARLEARYGIVLGHENKNIRPRDRTDEEVMAREDFERLNALDMELYRYAVELVAADGAAAGDQSVVGSR